VARSAGSGTLAGKDVPMIIAGAGETTRNCTRCTKAFHTARLPITMPGAGGILENFNDSQHGYLRITVTKKALNVEYVAVPDPSKPTNGPLKAFDAIVIKTNY